MQHYGYLIVLFCGAISASFSVPSLILKNNLNQKLLWLSYTFTAFIILPWTISLLFQSELLAFYQEIKSIELIIISFNGFMFGIGHLCLIYAIKHIGISRSFIMHIGIGIILASIYAAIYNAVVLTHHGILVVFSSILIILSLWIYYKIYQLRAKSKHIKTLPSYLSSGWFLAVIAGIASGIEYTSFFYFNHRSIELFNTSNTLWYWPIFLNAAAIPMLIFFITKILQNKPSRSDVIKIFKPINLSITLLMSLCFVGSLSVYCMILDYIGIPDKLTTWPILIISMVIISQAWGWALGEFQNSFKVYQVLSIIMILSSIFFLSF
ncbi:L-rhamnose/proton symporter RhaT [Thiotrichales bacterium 19S11-10]|nr:L-rhamnose/proton symporter RhaT [Thiotrichales bacterium 19S11-10]